MISNSILVKMLTMKKLQMKHQEFRVTKLGDMLKKWKRKANKGCNGNRTPIGKDSL